MATPKCVFQGGILTNPPKSHDNLTFGGNCLTTASKSLILMTFFGGGSKMITSKCVFQGGFLTTPAK